MSKYQKFNNALESFSCEAAYVLNKDLFNEEYFKVLKAFKSKYDKTNIAYSFKTNYIPDLVNEVRKNKGYAEVVSSMELKLAQKMGFKNANIFFNGPFKHKEFTQWRDC
jgi:diaminopimelate decarboxylase